MSIRNLAGQTLGQYQLKELLGIGGMGAVYRGHQPSLQRDVAIKVMSPELVTQPDYIERFYREARTAAALEHTHIVPVHDYGVQGDISYVVMRLLTGGTLMDRLAQQAETGQTLPALAETAEILKQLASALDYAHSKDVIHRDIKPSNVMFDNQGNAYLVDFGIAKLLTASRAITSSGVLMGTPLFMPPEQWRAEEVTPATDQYALGVMIYALVTGRVPFEADTPHGLMYKHLNEAPTPPQTYRPDTPEEVTQVLKRALAKDPADRFPTVTAFAQAFEKAIRGVEGEKTNFFSAPLRPTKLAHPPQTGMSGTVTDRRSRSFTTSPVVWAGVGIAVLALVLAAFFLTSEKDGSPESTKRQIETAAAQTIVAMNLTATASAPTLTPTQEATATPEVRAITATPQPAATATQAGLPAILVPTITPVLILPETQVWLDLSATASQWTPTDTATPSDTPNYTATYAAYQIIAGQTLTAQSWTDTPTLTWTPSSTPTRTPTPTFTATPSSTPTSTPTPTFTATPSSTPTSTPTPTPTSTPTATHTPTVTPSPTNTPTSTPTPIPPPRITTANAAQIDQAARFQQDWTWVEDIAWSPDGKYLAVSANAPGYWLYSAQDLSAAPATIEHEYWVGVNTIAWSSDGARVAFGDSEDTIHVMDATGGTLLFTLKGHADFVEDVAFSPDGKRLASASSDRTVRLWDMTTGQEIRLLEGHEAGVNALAWSPDGTRLVSGSRDSTARIWDIATGTTVLTLKMEYYGIDKIDWSGDGTLIAAGGYDGVVVWDAVTGQQRYAMGLGSGYMGGIAFSPDGTILAAGLGDNAIHLWEMATGRELIALARHTDLVSGIVWSPDGSLLASMSGDDTVRVWRVPAK